MQLFTPGKSNYKTAKQAEELGIHNVILHLAPAMNSGYEMCPFRSPNCTAACLYTAGRGNMDSTKQARIRKTRWFKEDREAFMTQIVREITTLRRSAQSRGMVAAVRLNGTSDVDWARVYHTDEQGLSNNLFRMFPDVQFYDYTKSIVMIRNEARNKTPNYHLTFSLSEINDVHAKEALDLGFNVAAVLRVAKGEAFPATWSDYPVIDGDEHDFRFRDPAGVIVGLRPKGRAISDKSGFVREIDDRLDLTREFAVGVAS